MTGRLWLLGVVATLLAGGNAAALDFRSVSEPAAILYDAPSLKAQKRFVLSHGYPVEVVIKLEGWTKIRDVHAWHSEPLGRSTQRAIDSRGK